MPGVSFCPMPSNLRVCRLTLCGPGDVQKEIDLAREAVDRWNMRQSGVSGILVKARHWKTDAVPESGDRSQAAINSQLIDDADIIVGIFWSRFGSPTGMADSGTEEEIRRGITLGKHVAVYFSELLPLPPGTEASQLSRLNNFRSDIGSRALFHTFQSRRKFGEDFETHLGKIVTKLFPAPRKRTRKPSSIGQSIRGNGNVQISGDHNDVNNHFSGPQKITQVVELPPDRLTPEQLFQIQEWIKDLAENTTSGTRDDAYGEWRNRLKNQFKVTRCELIAKDDFEDVRKWYRMVKGRQTRRLKRKAPDRFRASRIKAIKTVMKAMGLDKEQCYPQLAARLKIRPFSSLTHLTTANLDRVYARVMADQKQHQG